MNPSDFLSHPWESISGKVEAEIVAHNIMAILARTGDNWRNIGIDEYRKERQKDGGYSPDEDNYFGKVKGYCTNPDKATRFSSHWGKKR